MEKELTSNKRRMFFLVLYVFSLIVFFEPQGFKEPDCIVPWVDYIYKALKLICGFIIIVHYFLVNKKRIAEKKIDFFVLMTIVYQGLMLLSTIINQGSIFRFAGPSITVITMAMIAKCIIQENLLKEVIKIVNKYFAVVYVINLISMIIIGNPPPNGEGLYFLGYNNRFIFTFVPWIIFVGIEDLILRKKFTYRYYLVYGLIEVVLIYKWSVTAMIAMALFILPPLLKKTKIFYKTVSIVNIIINFIITKINLREITFLNDLVVNTLKKDLTFTGRVYLWNGVYSVIAEKPLLGYGTQSIQKESDFFYSTSGSLHWEFLRVQHAHNSLMSTLYRGGILSLISYLIISIYALKSLAQAQMNKYKSLLFICYIVILILSLFDTIDFAFCIYLPQYVNEEDNVLREEN